MLGFPLFHIMHKGLTWLDLDFFCFCFFLIRNNEQSIKLNHNFNIYDSCRLTTLTLNFLTCKNICLCMYTEWLHCVTWPFKPKNIISIFSEVSHKNILTVFFRKMSKLKAESKNMCYNNWAETFCVHLSFFFLWSQVLSGKSNFISSH